MDWECPEGWVDCTTAATCTHRGRSGVAMKSGRHSDSVGPREFRAAFAEVIVGIVRTEVARRLDPGWWVHEQHRIRAAIELRGVAKL